MTETPERIWIDKLNIPPSDRYAGSYYLDDDEEHETIEYVPKDVADAAEKAAFKSGFQYLGPYPIVTDKNFWELAWADYQESKT